MHEDGGWPIAHGFGWLVRIESPVFQKGPHMAQLGHPGRLQTRFPSHDLKEPTFELFFLQSAGHTAYPDLHAPPRLFGHFSACHNIRYHKSPPSFRTRQASRTTFHLSAAREWITLASSVSTYLFWRSRHQLLADLRGAGKNEGMKKTLVGDIF